ncbi:MAG: tail fiber protein [Arsenophonus sp. NC-PE1-MAG3]
MDYFSIHVISITQNGLLLVNGNTNSDDKTLAATHKAVKVAL